MKKKTQKPFNVEAAKGGAKIETRDGDSVRILCYDRKSNNNHINFPIIALTNHNGTESCFSYTSEGRLLGDAFDICEDAHDLVIIEEVECPKFNVGDWVFMNTHGSQPWLVIKVTPNYYEIKDSSGYITAKSHHTIDSLFHPWTLKDAKPGDILIDCFNKPFIFKGYTDKEHPGCPVAYCGINCNDEFTSNVGQTWWTDSSVRPATYEERQQLFNRLEAEGYKWNAESLTLTKIQKIWRGDDDENAIVSGYFIDRDSRIVQYSGYNIPSDHNIFATEKQAKSALAMAQISQIMANDNRFGGIVTDEEWTDKSWYSIIRINNDLRTATRFCYELLAFHTKKQADLFLEENRDLVKDYYMMD